MRTISERNGSEDETFRLFEDNLKNNFRVAIPGIIVSFDVSTQTAVVQPAIKENIRDINGNQTSLPLPLLLDVPIVLPRGGNFVLTMPIAAGDECLVVFADMCIDAWFSLSGVQNQIEKRRHDLSDAFAIMGCWSQPNKITNYSTTKVELRNEANTSVISIGDNTIDINSPTVKINNSVPGGTPGPQGPKGDTGATGADGPNLIATSTATDIYGFLKGNGSHVLAATLVDEDANGVYLGDKEGGNYTQHEPTGFPVYLGNALSWRDIDFPIIIRTTGANQPTLTTIQGNIQIPQWAVNDYNVCEGQELVHDWKEGSEVFWHVHMITDGLDTSNRYVKWEVEYFWVNASGVISSSTTVSHEYTIPANTASKTMFIVSIASFTPSGGKIGGHVYARLKRIAASGTAPTNNPWCSMLQLHIQCDTNGSRSISTK
jgi:hypothetical protein